AGVNVAIGTDGAAGNDSASVREELRWARTLQGARLGSTYLPPKQVLRMGTRAGRLALGWPKIGSLEVGQAADLAIFDLETLEFTGLWDPLTAFVANQATPAEHVFINGEQVVADYAITTIDTKAVIQHIKAHVRRLKERV